MILQRFQSAAIITFFIIVLISCKRSGSLEVTTEEEVLPEDIVELREDQIKLANIELGKIQQLPVNGTLKTSGTVSTIPQNYATVYLPMGGFVKSTSLMAGSRVSKGQTLATIENKDFIDIQQDFFEAKSEFEFAEADYKRHNELYKEAVYSQENMQQVTIDYKTLRARIKALEQKLSLIGIDAAQLQEDDISSCISVISPISGYIKSVNIYLGKYMAPSDVLFEIVNTDQLLLELTIFEKDANKVVAGQNIRFFINNEAEQHEAVVYQTGKSIGSDKTLKVYARVSGVCKNVLPGMFVNAVIEISGKKVNTLPADAIVSFDDRDYIFVFEKNKEEDGKPFTEYRMLQIEKGFTDDGSTEVILPEGFDIQNSKIVIKGAYNLLSAKKNAGEMAC